MVDFKNDSSPIRSKRNEEKQTFDLEEQIQDSDSDQNSGFSIRDSTDQENELEDGLPEPSDFPFGRMAKNGKNFANCNFTNVSEIGAKNKN